MHVSQSSDASDPPTTTPSSSSSKEKDPISKIIESHRPDLTKDYIPLYEHLHSHPELSFQERETAATISARLQSNCPENLELYTGIGGHGVVGILRNGSGATVLLRADIDALPILEKTGLPHASKVRMKDNSDGGVEKPVMHACGHDIHITSLLAASALLYTAKETWKGTCIFLFQPAEEKGAGAKAMVEEGKLYSFCPVPDVVLGGHVMPLRAGSLGTKRGLMASAADSLNITLYGRGGHASQPHRLIDPVVMAASTVLRLQTIVSREVDPADSAVVTCGSIVAGDAENVVSDTATLKLNVRTVRPETRKKVLGGVRRIVGAEAAASAALEEPEFKETSSFPFTVNDEDVTKKLEDGFSKHFEVGKKGYDSQADRLAGSEDFGILGTAINKPSCFWVYGGIDPELWDKAEKEGTLESDVPINHSPYFAPVPMPTLQVATDAYAVAALTWLAKV